MSLDNSYTTWIVSSMRMSINMHFLFPSIITLLFCVLLSIVLKKTFMFRSKKTKELQLPPSPPKLPLIGNLHQLGLLPHRSLHSLSRRHGPLMLLHLGSSPALVVSSPDVAREIFKTHDVIFSNRPDSRIARRFAYDNKDLAFVPYGDYWKQIRKISVSQLLSLKRVQSFRAVREQETALLVEKIMQMKHPSGSFCVDLSEMFVSLTNDVISRAAFGRKYSEGEEGRKFRNLLSELSELLGCFDLGEFIPWLSWHYYVTGLYHRVERVFKELDGFLDGVIADHVARKAGNHDGEEEDEMDFLDTLLLIQADGSSSVFLAQENIKAIILDVFAAGTATSYTALEWVMTELLRHPPVMEKVQKEIRGVLGTRSTIADSDMEKMCYMKAVIKETLRIHPPLPLLIQRESSEDVKVQGYDIPAKTRVLVSAWAIGRDPEYWQEPEEFKPERFLGSNIDFNGHDLQLIPFGVGRRGCPGTTFSIAIIELVLANLLHKFDWQLPGGARGEDLDDTESSGLAVHKKLPLLVVPTPHSCF